jgi:phosphopantetheine--protein transferase-like protein
MDKRQHLREIVARLCRVQQEEVLSSFPLGPLVSRSINVHLLDSALRKQLGVEPPPLQTVRTYADLEALVLGEADGATRTGPAAGASAAVPSPPARGGGLAGLACGLDLEPIVNLPSAEDHWTHEFYSNSFTRAEIAYCVAQAHPPRHFAARWCAKEALKKCDPAFLHEKLVDIEVVHDETNAPRFQLVRTGQILPHALSITHNESVAGAVVLHMHAAVPSAGAALPASAAESSGGRPSAESRGGGGAGLVFAVLATVLSGVALLRTFGF